jgi:hypothetical protein
MPQLESRDKLASWAEQQFVLALNASRVDIDFTLPPEPMHYHQTLPDTCGEESGKWREAMDDEISSMERFGVYTRVPLSAAQGRQILGCRWVYKRKTGKDGRVNRWRARLVAQGYRQRAWDSFNPEEVFSPVIHKDTLRLFLSLATGSNLRVHQADVKAAFLQAPLKEKIFMKAPPGYSSKTASGEEEILCLSSAIYGLKQASACFYEAVHEHLLNIGFESILGDPCLFKRVSADGGIILVCTYVDDITFAVSDADMVDPFMSQLRERFVIGEDEGGPIDYLLGIAVDQNLDAGTIHMNMELAITKLCKSILTEEQIAKADLVDSPMLPSPLKRGELRMVPKSSFDYLSVVGSLLHIANCVRPDISYAVGNLARFSLTPGTAHVNAAKRVLQYLWTTRTLGITYYRDSIQKCNVPLMYEKAKHPLDNGTNLTQVFADSDYAADETRRSTMGSVTMMNGGPISWFSILGKTVCLSTCEAEINAAVTAAKDALHLSRIICDLGFATSEAPIQIAEDNSAAIAQATGGIRHVRNAKHYEIRLHFLQQLVVDKSIEFKYCPTELQLADLMTKPLDAMKHKGFAEAILSYAI